jgi:heme exporter protein B
MSIAPFLSLIRRDLRLTALRGAEGLTALFFFVAVASLFPFALGSETDVLRKAAPGIVWISALLAALLSLETVYHRDFEDGTFDLLLLSSVPPIQIVLAKIFSHWALTGLGLVLASVPVAAMFYTPASAFCVLIPSLLLGTIYMSLLGAMGAVLTFGARRPGLLLTLLILPLFVPMLILGVMAGAATLADLPAQAYLLLQLSLVIAALTLIPPAAAKFLEMQFRSS